MEEVQLYCPNCNNIWSIFPPINGEVVEIGEFDDLCPLCEAQGKTVEETID